MTLRLEDFVFEWKNEPILLQGKRHPHHLDMFECFPVEEHTTRPIEPDTSELMPTALSPAFQ